MLMWNLLKKQNPVRMFATKNVLSSAFPSSWPWERQLLGACCYPGRCDTSEDKDKKKNPCQKTHVCAQKHCCEHSLRSAKHRIPEQRRVPSAGVRRTHPGLSWGIQWCFSSVSHPVKSLIQGRILGRNRKTGENTFLKNKLISHPQLPFIYQTQEVSPCDTFLKL